MFIGDKKNFIKKNENKLKRSCKVVVTFGTLNTCIKKGG